MLRDQTVSSTCEIRALEMESKIRNLGFALERGDTGRMGWPCMEL